MKSLDKKKKQDLEVTDWWNDDKTKKWQEFYNSDQNPSVDHVLERQKKTLDFLKSLKLKKMFNNNQFKILSKTGATYFIPKNKFNSFTIKGAMFKFFRKLDNMLQFIGDKNLIPYFFTLADNIIILGEKKNVQK